MPNGIPENNFRGILEEISKQILTFFSGETLEGSSKKRNSCKNKPTKFSVKKQNYLQHYLKTSQKTFRQVSKKCNYSDIFCQVKLAKKTWSAINLSTVLHDKSLIQLTKQNPICKMHFENSVRIFRIISGGIFEEVFRKFLKSFKWIFDEISENIFSKMHNGIPVKFPKKKFLEKFPKNFFDQSGENLKGISIILWNCQSFLNI